ncbi:hypothetical protein CASFOL_016715 [Castilleja foliolosa]|uniref:Transmembrane protein n=1 Tax=Castilleja foliolosa TaxID=1961234 RepID=A0ABD3D9J5_9LAMI
MKIEVKFDLKKVKKIRTVDGWKRGSEAPGRMLCFKGALGTWVFSVAGALIAIPVGIKRKSLAPLVFFGTTGTMLDIIMGITACEREHAERQMKLLEAQNASAADTGGLES